MKLNNEQVEYIFWDDMLKICEKYQDDVTPSEFFLMLMTFGLKMAFDCAPDEDAIAELFQRAHAQAKNMSESDNCPECFEEQFDYKDVN
jgi:hypothetical protein